MENTHPDSIKVDFNGKETFIKLGPAAFRIARLKGVLDFNVKDLDTMNLDVLAHLVYIGLLVNHPDLKEEDAMLWLAQSPDEKEIVGNVTAQLQAIGEFIKALAPGEEDEDEEGNEEKKPDP